MTMVIENTGRQTLLFNLTTTGEVTVLAGDTGGIATIESISWCCKANASDLSISVTDGTTTSYLLSAEPQAAKSHEIISSWHPTLPNGSWALKAQASVANEINLTVVYAKSTQNR
jgi:hypothetical protein